MEKRTTSVAMVPCPGLSHLIPLVEFAKRFVHLHHETFNVTFLIPTLGPPSSATKSILESLPSAIDYTILKQVNMEDLPQGIHQVTQMQLTVSLSLPSVHNALSSLSSHTKLVAVIAHWISVEALDIAKQFNILRYVYIPSAVSLSLALYIPKLDQTVSGEFKDLNEPIILPGGMSIRTGDLPEVFQIGRCSDAYKSIVHICSKLSFTDGFVVNSFNYLENRVIQALQEKEAGNNVPVYPVGPIIQSGSISKVNGSECLKWLDNQSEKSVLYVSFGSGGTLSQEQLNELAFGLEMSGHKFLWAVRAPSESPSAAYLSAQKGDPLQYLPNGFLERITNKQQALVVASWAPQVEVLSHSSIGGFLSHCGWNSTLESVVRGIPIIAWPLFAEQKVNAVMLSEELKVALRPKANEDGIVEREAIAEAVKSVMEGDEGREMCTRITRLKDAAVLALSKDGSSTRTLSTLALKWQEL